MNTDEKPFMRFLAWAASLVIAGVLLWYEQYKLNAVDGSVALFNTLADWLFISGYERPFRLGVATAEIIASVLVLDSATRRWGALLALGVMSGAIFFHLVSPLGVDPYGDGGSLFKQACTVWVLSAFIIYVYRRPMEREIRALLAQYVNRKAAKAG